MKKIILCAFALLLCVAHTTLLSQSIKMGFKGNVLDQNGQAVPTKIYWDGQEVAYVDPNQRYQVVGHRKGQSIMWTHNNQRFELKLSWLRIQGQSDTHAFLDRDDVYAGNFKGGSLSWWY